MKNKKSKDKFGKMNENDTQENGVVEINDECEVTSENEGQDILPGCKTIDDFVQKGFQAAMEVTKMANRLPSGHRWDVYTSYPSFHRLMNDEGNRMVQIMSMILKHQGIGANVMRRDVEEKFDLIVEANDAILERVGFNLDDLAGIRRNPEPVLMEAAITRPVTAPWNSTEENQSSTPRPAAVVGSGQTVRLLTARNIERPQAKFRDKIDNSADPFEPIIKYKPNSITPLAITLEVTEDGERFCHPYEYELERLKVPESQLTRVANPKFPAPLEETPLVVVERPEDIHIMLEDLRKYKEVAVDLEHHSYRTYQGLTCLMQLSTRDTDYIVDTLALRSDLQCLNDIFTDPKVVKVLHGADSDVEWLQRDLGLYLVNMFDTHQAARVLGLAHLSLAFLLKHYCRVTANKQYQLADWRIRPLPEELVSYAREDTHYLLYIYDVVKNELLDKANGKTNLLLSVIQRSTEICKKRYEKPIVTEQSHVELYQRHKKLFDNRQMYALRELFHWRDKKARQEDESTGYVLPNHMLLQIAEVLPREMQGILACCNPIPPLVRQNLNALHQIVLKAREQSLVRPVVEEERHARPAAQTQFLKVNLEGPLLCPHDLSHAPEFRDDLPCLLTAAGEPMSDVDTTNVPALVAEAPTVTVFADAETWDDVESEELPARLKQVRFVSPYSRYLRVRPYTHQLEVEEAEQRGVTPLPAATVDDSFLKRELDSDTTDGVADTSLPSSVAFSPAAAKASTSLDTSFEMKRALKREEDSSDSDSPERKKKYQPMPEESSVSSVSDILSGRKKKKKKKKQKTKGGNLQVANSGETEADAVDSEATPPPAALRLSAGQKRARLSDADGDSTAQPTPTKLTKTETPSACDSVHQDRVEESGSTGPSRNGKRKFKKKASSQQYDPSTDPQSFPGRTGDSWQAGGMRGGRGTNQQNRTGGSGGFSTPMPSRGGLSGPGPSRGGLSGPGPSRGGRNAPSTPAPVEGNRNAAPDGTFRPFDYCQVDYDKRFKGGSKRKSVQGEGTGWKKNSRGRRGKARFAGKVNQKSLTFAKKHI